jgi:c-di-GMP-binding flagellar brake protein YcgR
MKTFKERRKHERFSVKNRSTVLVSPTTILSYAVLDVSDSGLAFSYIGWENWPTNEIKLDILDQEFFLENIPISVIEDVRLDDESKKLRRCGVKFTSLMTDQKAILKQYIASVAAN